MGTTVLFFSTFAFSSFSYYCCCTGFLVQEKEGHRGRLIPPQPFHCTLYQRYGLAKSRGGLHARNRFSISCAIGSPPKSYAPTCFWSHVAHLYHRLYLDLLSRLGRRGVHLLAPDLQ